MRWTSGTPPSSHSAPCSPALRLAKLSAKQTDPASQFEYVRTKWYTRWGNGAPAIVTPRSVQCVKSLAHSRPG